MPTDYNKDKIVYQIFSQNVGTAISGRLHEKGIVWLISLDRSIGHAAAGASDIEREFLGRIAGCLHHLNAFLLQCERLAHHIEVLLQLPLPETHPEYPVTIVKEQNELSKGGPFVAPAMVRIGVERVEHDFEQLLLSGVATLEVLALLISTSILQKESSYYDLNKNLKACQDPRAIKLTDLIKSTSQKIDNILVSAGQKSLRNRIAHRSSIPELTQRAMTFHLLPDNKILRFDHEIAGMPMIATIHTISRALAYFVGASCGVLFAMDNIGSQIAHRGEFLNIESDWFLPIWSNPTVFYDDYIDPTGQGPKVTIFKPILGGFRPHTQHLRADVFDHAMAFDCR